jgi:hypothetical protein
MESVKIDYLVENTFRETSIAEEKELRTYFFLHRMLQAFRTIQAYFLNISLCQRAAVYVSSTTTPKAET